ncbi:hypothetical protein SBDP2_1930005 [Syntrophobacter sp. SbD2]|nr:hypothetical protein SBDP2_1930005 [Syntrophobacter sp. SbD2]
MSENKLPSFDQLMNPLIQALRQLGGSASVEEIYANTVEITDLPEEVVSPICANMVCSTIQAGVYGR